MGSILSLLHDIHLPCQRPNDHRCVGSFLGLQFDSFTMIFGKSPVVIATLMAVALNLILPKEEH